MILAQPGPRRRHNLRDFRSWRLSSTETDDWQIHSNELDMWGRELPVPLVLLFVRGEAPEVPDIGRDGYQRLLEEIVINNRVPMVQLNPPHLMNSHKGHRPLCEIFVGRLIACRKGRGQSRWDVPKSWVEKILLGVGLHPSQHYNTRSRPRLILISLFLPYGLTQHSCPMLALVRS
ncbi:hypothetical protein BX600DRAFT_127348 [Xylariales sp. PMI_506]|nr:hypothetical protein BX600DRAFT_127348 [Xylariales sp. PMI_506]